MSFSLLEQRGGIARSADLIAAGRSRYSLDREIRAGRLRRIRRGWLALPDADPVLVFAASHGLTVSCISLAHWRGLWVRDATQQHFAVPRPGSETRPPGARLHYHRPIVPRHRYALHDGIENALVAIARCQPFEDAVATWDSALNQGLVDHASLTALPLGGTARRVLAATTPFADSGLESYVRVRLSWLRIPIRSQIWLFGHRVDFLIGERLVLQIDGGHHVDAQRMRDNIHDAELESRGYRVIRVGYVQVIERWPEVQDLIMRAIALGHHRA